MGDTVRMRYEGPINDESGIFSVLVGQQAKKPHHLQFRPECDVPVECLPELRQRKIQVKTVRPEAAPVAEVPKTDDPPKVAAARSVRALVKAKAASQQPETEKEKEPITA